MRINNDFIIENGTLIEYTGNDAEVVVPSDVTTIGKYAFACCDF